MAIRLFFLHVFLGAVSWASPMAAEGWDPNAAALHCMTGEDSVLLYEKNHEIVLAPATGELTAIVMDSISPLNCRHCYVFAGSAHGHYYEGNTDRAAGSHPSVVLTLKVDGQSQSEINCSESPKTPVLATVSPISIN